jgi:ribosomal protein S18 acetylase RimI-like enzyme
MMTTMSASPSPKPYRSALRFRSANAGDAEQVARLHAESWRRHYRGAFADSYLDSDVVTDRLAVWSARFAEPVPSATILAEDDTSISGFVHVIFDHDDEWGSLIDNLHVVPDRQRSGVGRILLTSAAQAVAEQAASTRMYLWVLEQNTAAQGFYRALGGICAGIAPVPPPGGMPGRLTGSPSCLRIAWLDARSLLGCP